MTYNQSILNNYRSELLHETSVGQEETLYIRQHDSEQIESPTLQHCQQMMEENSLNVEQKQKANEQIDHDNKNSDDIQSGDALLLIRRFKSKTCPYCNGQRDAKVKHINPHTKPSTSQAFYNDILINKYRHVQSPQAQRNLTLNMNVDCNADKRQENDVAMHMENRLLQKEYKEEQMQKETEQEEEEQCKQEAVQKEDNPDIVFISTATADHVEQYEQHKLYKNTNGETANDKLQTHESNNKYSPSKLFVLGPMVDQSELPFRMLCREYGATVAFTPMLHAKNFVESAQYRQRFYSTTSKKEVLHALQEQNENLEKEEEEQEVERQNQEQLRQESYVQSCRLEQEQQSECEEKELNEELHKCEKADKYMEDKHNKLIDRPLVVQICGNDADTILAAARLVLYSNDYSNKSNDKSDGKKGGHDNSKQKENEVTANACNSCITIKESKGDHNKQEDTVNYKVNGQNVSNNTSDTFPLYSCDAVDINLGCPQGIAKRGHYGSFLMEDWERIHTIIHTLHVELEIPVTAKIRVFDKPRSAKQHNINNIENINNNFENNLYNNLISHNNSTKLATKCSVDGNIGSEVNEENKMTQSDNDIDASKECTSCVESLTKHKQISYDQSDQNYKQRTERENDHSMHKMQSSDQSMELNQMCTMETHHNLYNTIEEDYYIIRCNKQDNYSSSSDDSLEYDAALTIAYAMMVRDAGAQMLTIHGRTRAMKGQNTKLANLELIHQVHSALNGSIPIIANGNVLTFDDVVQNMKTTHCEGVMCAEPLLWDPSLFAHQAHPILCGRSFAADQITRLRAIQLALRYVSWCACYPVELGMIKAHLYKLCYHSYEIHCTLRNALAHVCEDANLLSTSSAAFEETTLTKAEAGNTAYRNSEQTILQENVCKEKKVASSYCNLYMQQLNALRRHLHELYKTEEASTITGPQPKLLRLAKEANRAELHANNFFDDTTNKDDNSISSAKLKENNNAEANELNDGSIAQNGDTSIRDEDDDDNTLGIVF